MIEKSKNTAIRGRITELMRKTGLSARDLEHEAGLENGNINKWEDRHLENSTKMIKQFLAHWRINSIWWRTGEGDIFEPDPTSDRKPEVITNKSEPSELQQALLEWKGLFFQAKHDLKIAQEKIVELENRLKDKGGHSARDSK